MAAAMDFPGAHGDEIVRDFLIDNSVCNSIRPWEGIRLIVNTEPASHHLRRRWSSPTMGTRSTTRIGFRRRHGYRQEEEAQRQEEEGQIQPILEDSQGITIEFGSDELCKLCLKKKIRSQSTICRLPRNPCPSLSHIPLAVSLSLPVYF
jgi:hypothetical protein